MSADCAAIRPQAAAAAIGGRAGSLLTPDAKKYIVEDTIRIEGKIDNVEGKVKGSLPVLAN